MRQLSDWNSLSKTSPDLKVTESQKPRGKSPAQVLVIVILLASLGGAGYLYYQTISLQNRVSTLQSQASFLQRQVSLYEKNLPVLFGNRDLPIFFKASQACKLVSVNISGDGVGVAGFDGGILLMLTNVGNESVAVPASGVRILAPNGTQVLPTPVNHIIFYDVSFVTAGCPVVDTTNPPSTVTVPAKGTASIAVDPTTPISAGNYILTFANVMTPTNQQVSVDPVWVYYDCVCG